MTNVELTHPPLEKQPPPAARLLEFLRARTRERVEIARELPGAGRGVVVASLAVNVLLGVLPVLFILGTSIMLGRVPAATREGVGSGAWDSLVYAFLLAASAFVVLQLLTPLQASLGELITRRVDGRFADRLIGDALRTPGIGPLEDQELLNDLSDSADQLEFGFRSPGRACAGLVALVARYLQLVALVVVVGVVFSWIAGAALFVATMLFRYGQRGGLRKYSAVFRRTTSIWRRNNYFRRIGVDPPAAKELRVFGLAPWVRDRYRESFLEFMGPVWKERRRIYLGPFLVFAGFGLIVSAGALAALGHSAAGGGLTLRDLALTFQAAIAAVNLGSHYPESDTQTQFGMLAYAGMIGFERGVERYEGSTVHLDPPRDPEGLPKRELSFEAVTFGYPGSERMVLNELELSIPAGKSTAIVGLNGAGKTTLVKLLGRLYEPVAGRIAADGIDIRHFPIEGWHRQIGIIFQDFNRYELSAADNIGFGSVPHLDDREAILRAASRAGIREAIDGLPKGFDTPLSRQYEGGADLSGGQWQRVAIARALFALEGGASMLVLDEPTAALDVRAEAAFFDNFVELTRGVTTILISHRFSSVRHADGIVVLQGGRVVEKGTHEQLLAAEGRYARLFRLQAERFARGEEEGEEEDDEL
ncbi:MAG: ABC transporter ATP-binding protein [Gaiellaceae bacterium]